MALPREPRQKMINIMYLVLTAILALNVSAEVINAFRTVDKSLRDSNGNIEKGNQTIFQSLAEQKTEAQTKEKAEIWEPKAQQAKQYSDAIYNYIEGLKGQVKKESDLKVDKNGNPILNEYGNENFKEDYLEASTRVFETKGEGKILYQKLQDYKTKMLNIDPAIGAAFKNSFPVDMNIPPSHSGNKNTGDPVTDWTASYFHMTPAIAALTMLSKFENNIKNAENLVVTYCQNQIGKVKFVLNKFEPIAVANSTYLMPGEEITVSAGVGAFNDAAKPEISINGAPEMLNANGVAEKKFNVSGGGAQKIRVHIVYTDPNTGKKETLDKEIDYTVGTPGGAAVMLDRMNVFYIGVDNPVTIGSPTGWDKTNVTMTGGSISGAGSKRVVRVSSIGNATINVTANGKTTPFPFRIKRIPDPIFKVGPSAGGRVQSVMFKNQQFARAELENFDFDARFTVVSATVYFAGANFSNVQTATISGGSLAGLGAQLSKCIPGTSVTFDNVKVQGPDGAVRNIQGPGFILY